MNQPFQRYFFEIAIYRCKEDDYIAELDEATKVHLRWLFTQSGGVTREQAPDSYMHAEQYVWEKCGGPWHYNQVIGWLRLYVLGSQIRGDLFYVKAKRIQRFQKAKEYRYLGTAFELSFNKDDSAGQIFEEVYDAIKELGREKKFRNRYVDLEAFNNIGRYVDWRSLIGFER